MALTTPCEVTKAWRRRPRPPAIASVLLAAWLALGVPDVASAHGAPASVLSVVRSEADGRPRLLRLSEGLAARTGDRYRYVCAALFDADETPRAAALSGTKTLVATARSLYLLDEDGSASAHPDASAVDRPLRALDGIAAGGAVALRDADPATTLELVQLDDQAARALAQLPRDFTSVAAEGEALVVAGLTIDGRAQQRGFELDGSERPEWTREALAPPDAIAALARLASGQPYVLVLAGDGPISELVQLDDGDEYRLVQRASVSLSGPVASDADHVYVAFDGRLGTLEGGAVTPVETDAPVTCVLRSGEHAYACVGSELRRLSADGVGERVFGLDEIGPPLLDALEPSVAERCNLQWLRFRVDLIGAGITPVDDVQPDAGADGGMRDAGDGASHANTGDGGCSARRGAGAAEARGTWVLALVAWAWAWARRDRRRRGRP